MGEKEKEISQLLSIISKLNTVILILTIGLILLPFVFYYSIRPKKEEIPIPAKWLVQNEEQVVDSFWKPVSLETIQDKNKKELALYGKELIANTAAYLGPNGSVHPIGNGMNCQNCHLEAGTAVYGNNYGSVFANYPKFRARSGTVENIYKRVNDCFERSLNGKALDTNSREMQAIKTYIEHIGSMVPKGQKAIGSGFKEIAFLQRAADPIKGKLVYNNKCSSCHQANGQGVINNTQTAYTYPPLWGKSSYNDGAGLYRISNFAKYVKYNMPQGTTHENPQLTDEEAWDVAAFVNNQDRPHIAVPKDWPDISKKPIDHPFGPYQDPFTEKQHKFGPYPAIQEFYKKLSANQKNKS